MGKVLPDVLSKRIKDTIFQRADTYGYGANGRIDNGIFLDQLVEDPEIGGVLAEYLPKERIRTYIKDGVLNAYAKRIVKNALSSIAPEKLIQTLFSIDAEIIQREGDNLFVLRASQSGRIFIISKGTVVKWETALRKALEIISREPNLIINQKTPSIILQLAISNGVLTDADKKHIMTALQAINVFAYFSDC